MRSIAWRRLTVNDNEPRRPDGKPMTVENLQALRAQLEAFDQIETISDEMRAIIEAYLPDLVDRLPPRRS
jgi:hypothetical protein